jgi:Phosphodiester glycosidase/FlgD Ig-like domain
VLFTPAWGATTPVVAGSTEAVLEPFPSAAVDADLTAAVTSQASGGGTPIPPDGAVLMSVGSPPLATDAAEGQSVTVRLILPSDWSSVVDAVGGGPLLVKNGKPVFHTGEDFDAGALAARDARAGVGQLADGRIVLVAVDGEQPGYSAGVSTFELAQTMAGLGAVTAAALGSGSAVTAAFDGNLLDRPPTAGGGKVKEALLVQYAGVYAPPPPVAELGAKNVAAGEQLAYRIVRPSTVTASVIAPDGTAHTLDSGSRQPGTYSFTWSDVDAEGTWHWRVTATDDLNRQSQVDETFTYDLTLSALSVPRTATAGAGVTARFTLSRPATAALDVETPGGTVVRSLPAQDLPAGAASLRWDGTLDGTAKAPPGSYVARVTATSAIGQMALTAPFTLRS